MRRNEGGALRDAGAQPRLRRVAAAAVRPVPAPEGRLPATYLTLWYQTTARRTQTGLQGTLLPSQPAAAAAGAAATRRSAALVHGVHAAEPPPLVAVARGASGRLQALEAARIPLTTGLKTLVSAGRHVDCVWAALPALPGLARALVARRHDVPA